MKFLYDFRSPLLIIIEIIGIIFLIFGISTGHYAKGFWLIPLFLSIACYLFLRICTFIKWYNGFPKYAGIGLHFQRGKIVGSYLIFLLSIFNWFELKIGLIFVLIFFILLAHINIYLIAIHLADKDRTPPNLYSGLN